MRNKRFPTLTYNAESDTAYIGFAPDSTQYTTETLSLAETEFEGHEAYADSAGWITLDFSPDGKLVGIDVLFASSFLPAELLADTDQE